MLVNIYLSLTKPATLTGKQPALRGSSQKVQMAGKTVQIVKELSTSYHGLPILASVELDQMERKRKYTLILVWWV